MYQQYATSIESYMATGDATWRNMRGTSLKVMRCPADTLHDRPWTLAGGGWARGNYGCNAGGIHGPQGAWTSTANGASPTNDWGWGGLPTTWTARGVMCINWGANLPRISDGTSNTALLGELRNGAYLSDQDARGTWAVGLPGCSVICGNSTWDCITPN